MFPREQLMRNGQLDSHACAVIEQDVA